MKLRLYLAFCASIAGILLLTSCSEQSHTVNSSQTSNAKSTAEPEIIGGPQISQGERQPLEWAQNKHYKSNSVVSLDIKTVVPHTFDPKNKVARGWGADGKPKRMTKRIPPEEAQRLRDEAMKLPPNPKLVAAQRVPLTNRSPLAQSGFESLDINDCCGGGATTPPDPELAVGPNHIIAVINSAFEIYDKEGNSLIGPLTFSSFFASESSCNGVAVFDPNALYDESADRFILGIDCNGTDYGVAVSQTSDPTGSWYLYSFATDFAGAFFDYPHAGVGVDAIYMGSNQFGGTLPGGFEGRVFAIDKNAMYAGSDKVSIVSNSTGSNGTPQPMNLHGYLDGTWPNSGPHYIMTEVFDGANHTVWSWSDAFESNTFTNEGNLNLNTATGVTAGFPIDVPQSGGQLLQANDWRGLDTEYRNGNIWMTNTIACNPGGGTVNCLRWAKIDPTGPTVLDAGVIASTGDHRTFPDLAVNRCDDMAIGYTKSNSSMFPSVFVTGRENGDAAGTTQTEVLLKAGEITYSAFDTAPRRWGDYTGMTIDPDGSRFWYIGEYSKVTGNASGRWGTYVGSYNFAACPPTQSEICVPIKASNDNVVTVCL